MQLFISFDMSSLKHSNKIVHTKYHQCNIKQNFSVIFKWPIKSSWSCHSIINININICTVYIIYIYISEETLSSSSPTFTASVRFEYWLLHSKSFSSWAFSMLHVIISTISHNSCTPTPQHDNSRLDTTLWTQWQSTDPHEQQRSTLSWTWSLEFIMSTEECVDSVLH